MKIPKIVIVDDSNVMRSILRKSILMTEHDVGAFIEAADGLEGTACIREHADDISIVFTDLDMPNATGVQMLTTLQQEQVGGFPVVVVTTVGNQHMRNACKALGAVAFLNKPFTQEELGELLNAVLQPPAGG